jgi:thioredoxin reductase (NADPH)
MPSGDKYRFWSTDRQITIWRAAGRAVSSTGVHRAGTVPPVKRVAAAVGEGSMAIAFVHQYLRESGVAGGRRAASRGALVVPGG